MTMAVRRAGFLAAALCGVLLLAPSSPGMAETAGPGRAEALNGLLDAALEDHSIPAMTVLVIRDGKIAGQAVRGVRAADSPDPARIDDAWHIGSDAKAMTATMIARLVERGTLSWTTPLRTLLPGVRMRPEYQDLTLIELLSHRAGLRDLDDTVDAKMIADAFADTRPLPRQRQAFAMTVLNEAPIGPARAASVYSNSDYVLAGAIAEQATGKSFETLVQEEVFAPLGMKVEFSASRRGQVLGHQAGKALTGPKSDNPQLFGPAGEVKLTMHDWALFAIDQMAGEKGQGRLLKQDTYRLLHTRQGDTNAALGWGVKTDWPKDAPIRMLTHAGSNGYWNALIALAPDQAGGVLIAANAAEGTDVQKRQTAILLKLMAGIVKVQ